MEELIEIFKKVVDALDETTETFNYGIYDDLIKKAKETLEKYNL